ncbi:MAG TPA: hypothetical protein VMU33_15485 [Burkholderiaceae bacterium]|nr:hypothetical protein [Burkholderiaceae bacterium]
MKRSADVVRIVLAALAVAAASAVGAATAAATAAPSAEDRAALEQSHVIGNRELPKVLYIVPWKRPAPGDLSGRPIESVLDEALAPLDRDVFRRQIRYDAQVEAPPVSPAPVATVPAPK